MKAGRSRKVSVKAGNETGLSRLGVLGRPIKGRFVLAQGLSPLGCLACFGTTRDRPAVHATRAKCREAIMTARDLNFRCYSPHRAVPHRNRPHFGAQGPVESDHWVIA
jgi:hypothetical protein